MTQSVRPIGIDVSPSTCRGMRINGEFVHLSKQTHLQAKSDFKMLGSTTKFFGRLGSSGVFVGDRAPGQHLLIVLLRAGGFYGAPGAQRRLPDFVEARQRRPCDERSKRLEVAHPPGSSTKLTHVTESRMNI